MKYRDFGSTGLKISEIVFGAGAVGGRRLHLHCAIATAISAMKMKSTPAQSRSPMKAI